MNCLLSLLMLSGVALAQDPFDEDDLFDDDPKEEEEEEDDFLDDEEDEFEFDDGDRLDEADDLDDEAPDDLEGETSDEPETDLLGDEDVDAGGEDSAQIYRAYEDKVDGLAPDELVAAWKTYLERYPNTVFRDRVQEKIDAAMEALYSERIVTDDGGDEIDANKAQMSLAQPMALENMNPRRRLQVGFEWGLPDYANLYVDYEHAIVRNFSVHGGIRNRYTGYSVEPGVRWAFVKDARTHTIVSLLGDVHVNINPAFVGFRPQIAAGKRFGDKLDVQAQLGVDVHARKFATVVLVGGANLTYMAAPTVALFFETTANAKSIGADQGPFVFNTASFGMKFFPGKDRSKMEVNAGASVPYVSSYWQYHYGSIQGQFNYYLDDVPGE